MTQQQLNDLARQLLDDPLGNWQTLLPSLLTLAAGLWQWGKWCVGAVQVVRSALAARAERLAAARRLERQQLIGDVAKAVYELPAASGTFGSATVASTKSNPSKS